ncbi:MAG: hypothetical protein ACI84K_000160 [Pseudohongiellaceae bacterium]|jgi:uncharacterized protein YbgA (DUF1722 family)/uncharacterized protein YbbK (DUF523 family)
MSNQDIIVTDSAIAGKKPSIQVGLSACLAGEKVRYNGGHTQSRLCLDILSEHFNFNTFCPEVAAGFGTPRPAMRLIGNPDKPELVFSNGDTSDLTEQLVSGFEKTLTELGGLDGYILMKNSPSCGLEKIKVYQPNGQPHQTRRTGLFTEAFQNKYPLIPIEEEGRLNDDALYDNFILRVYAHNNFRREVLQQPTIQNLIAFHSSYKYLLMAHHQEKYRELGRLLGAKEKPPFAELIDIYFKDFMQALSKPASRKNHTNTLFHILGYLKTSLPSVARRNIVDVISKYKDGIMPLETPLTLLTHYLSQYGSRYINGQRYLNPYPESIHPIRRHCR